MGNYTFKESKQKERKPHPIWRGIGCVLMILNPVMSYFGMILIMQLNAQNGWFKIPNDLYVEYKDPLIMVNGIVFLIILFLLFSIYALFVFIIQKVAGPARYGIYDVPPVWYRGKRYKR
jgi:hypothetical protein